MKNGEDKHGVSLDYECLAQVPIRPSVFDVSMAMARFMTGTLFAGIAEDE